MTNEERWKRDTLVSFTVDGLILIQKGYLWIQKFFGRSFASSFSFFTVMKNGEINVKYMELIFLMILFFLPENGKNVGGYSTGL